LPVITGLARFILAINIRIIREVTLNIRYISDFLYIMVPILVIIHIILHYPVWVSFLPEIDNAPRRHGIILCGAISVGASVYCYLMYYYRPYVDISVFIMASALLAIVVILDSLINFKHYFSAGKNLRT